MLLYDRIDPDRKEPSWLLPTSRSSRSSTENVSTANYDAVVAALDLSVAPAGCIVHTSGFDHEKGVFRIFDVWESREAGETWIADGAQPGARADHGRGAGSGRRSRRPPPTTGTTCTTR